MTIVAVSVMLTVLNENGEPENHEFLNHVGMAGEEFSISQSKGFKVTEHVDGTRDFEPDGTSTTTITIKKRENYLPFLGR